MRSFIFVRMKEREHLYNCVEFVTIAICMRFCEAQTMDSSQCSSQETMVAEFVLEWLDGEVCKIAVNHSCTSVCSMCWRVSGWRSDNDAWGSCSFSTSISGSPSTTTCHQSIVYHFWRWIVKSLPSSASFPRQRCDFRTVLFFCFFVYLLILDVWTERGIIRSFLGHQEWRQEKLKLWKFCALDVSPRAEIFEHTMENLPRFQKHSLGFTGLLRSPCTQMIAFTHV